MKILSIKLQNFKGIRAFGIDTHGGNVNIYGDNATGKTTLADAFMWLLFDKDSLNRKDFEIKTLTASGEPEHGLEHSVEAVLKFNAIERLTLKKVYQEKWTKKRGSAIAEFSGHTTDYFIDGVPAQKKEYDAKIAEIADESIFRLLTDPRYFNEVLHWQKRRELLLEVCGDVSDAEVIAGNADLADLSEILGNRTIEQHRKVIQARRAEINKELERIPVRIDEVLHNLPNVDDIADKAALEKDLAKFRAMQQVKQDDLSQLRAGGASAQKTKELRLLEAQMIDLHNRHKQSTKDKVAEKRKELSEIQSEAYKRKAEIIGATHTIQRQENEINYTLEKIAELREQWQKESDKVFTPDINDTCPVCCQALPAEQIEKAHEKALAEFNRKKAVNLEEISALGNKYKARKDVLEVQLMSERQKLEANKEVLTDLEQKEASLKAEIDAITAESVPFEETPEFAGLNAKINAVKVEVRELEADISEAALSIQMEINEITATVHDTEQAIAKYEARENGEKRIEDLKGEERRLAAEFEELERQLYLTEEFIRTKVRFLEDSINSKFNMARFKLFDIQINGALAETCETTYNGVPYSNLNNGAKLNIGLDIINTFSRHFGFAPPVWLDNAESVTDITPTRGQQIRLIVSAQDKKLRIEH